MTLLHYTEDLERLYQFLARVAQGIAVYHDSCDVHAQGFAWCTSDMSEPVRELGAYALREGLLHIGIHSLDGSAVSLTGAGEDRLARLRSQHNAAVRTS